jgi:hypothetical protein
VLIEPSLQVRVGPLRVEPVAWVGCSLASLSGRGLVVRASGGEERIASAWRWVGDVVVVEERLELRLSPAESHVSMLSVDTVCGDSQNLRVKDVGLDITGSLVCLVGSGVPVRLDLLEEAVLVLLGALLRLLALGCEVARQLVGVPLAVWLGNIVVPVLLNQVLEVLAIRSCGVGDVVIGQPALKLSLMPLVVDCAGSRQLECVQFVPMST